MDVAEPGIIAATLAITLGLVEVIKALVKKREESKTVGHGELLHAFEGNAKENVETLREIAHTQGKFVEAARGNGEKLDDLNAQMHQLRDKVVENGQKLDSVLRRVDK